MLRAKRLSALHWISNPRFDSADSECKPEHQMHRARCQSAPGKHFWMNKNAFICGKLTTLFQGRQRQVRGAVEAVRQAEERIDGLVKDLHESETELSLLSHRSQNASFKSGRRPAAF